MTNGTNATETPAAKSRTGARQVASKALDNARSSARRTAESAGENPLALLAGGVALGVLIGVLLPRPEREREALKGVGKKLADGASKALNHGLSLTERKARSRAICDGVRRR